MPVWPTSVTQNGGNLIPLPLQHLRHVRRAYGAQEAFQLPCALSLRPSVPPCLHPSFFGACWVRRSLSTSTDQGQGRAAGGQSTGCHSTHRANDALYNNPVPLSGGRLGSRMLLQDSWPGATRPQSQIQHRGLHLVQAPDTEGAPEAARARGTASWGHDWDRCCVVVWICPLAPNAPADVLIWDREGPDNEVGANCMVLMEPFWCAQEHLM